MDDESRPARRNSPRRRGWTPIAVQLAVPVMLGALIGGVLSYQAGSSNNLVHPVPLGAVPVPTPSFGRPSPPATTPPPGPAAPLSTATPADGPSGR